MSTIDSKAMIDAMIALDGYYGQDPRVALIVEYDTPEGKTTYGVTWSDEPLEQQGRYLVETEFILRPRIIWQGNVVPGTPHDNTGRDDKVTVDKMAAELQPLGPMELVVSPLTVLQLAGLLQLANRHPDIQAPSRDAVARFLDGARQYFASCPTVLEVLRQGDLPEFDRHRDERGPDA